MKQWRKGSKTIDEYLQGLINKFDQLALLGTLIDHEDQIEYVLDGLPEEYKTIVDQINGRDTPPTLIALHEKLLNHEASLIAVTEQTTFPVMANYVNNKPRNNNNQHHNRSGPRLNQNWNLPRQDQRPSKPYLGRCQICGIQGH